ncbi:DUF3152 domain-containing protein [Micromonospora sp. SH-82]|uniref:DUF3152 domain-containing protein n=1 Tax=Micromonospora sp. SH-82 TaxID=3132938 RepID=UPI003EBF4DB3
MAGRRTDSERALPRSHRRRSRGVGALPVALVAAVVLIGGGVWTAGNGGFDALLLDGVTTPGPVRAQAPPPPTEPVTAAPVPSAAATTPPPEPAVTFPRRGTGRFYTATARGAVAGNGGRLLRYRVTVEEGIENLDVERFGREVAAILADERGWTADGRWRLQRVGPDGAADFTVRLSTPVTRSRLCGDLTDLYTSCRNGDDVVLNVARWVDGVPHFDGDQETYRQYLVNHEVGHRLGRGHELCPRAGGPAPVMQQQTLGLHGCAPNAWPMVSGRSHTGPSGQYDDPIPTGS